MTHDELQELVRELNVRDAAYALVTVVRAVAPTSAYLGAQAIVLPDGTLHGWIGGGCARSVIIRAAQSAIQKGEPKLVRISNDQLYAEEDVEHYAMSCASNGSVELFIQPFSTHSALCVLGSTPAADEARFLAERLRVWLTDTPDAAPIVLVATQGQGDEEALEAALRSPARQVLMIASRQKADRLRTTMRMRGLDESQLARMQAPAGPDAGAKTPGEIALVAMVGVLAALRGRCRSPLDIEAVQRGAAAAPGQEDGRVKTGTAPLTAAAEGEASAISGDSATGEFINPVCGRAVSIANPLHVEVYAGETYYFCCDDCRATFRKDPEKYAAIRRSHAVSADVSGC
jgi:xanthine dehydrogenase accessory factor